MKTEKFYNANSDQWHTKTEVINDIINMLDCTEEEAENHLEYSIKHNLIYTEEGYKKHFAPYEN